MMYTTILADPPWAEHGGGRIKRGADRHYGLLSEDQIYSTIILSTPCGTQLAAAAWDGYFFMWVTSNHEKEGHALGEMLRLRYVTDFVWVKGRVVDGVLKLHTGLGQYRRGAHERMLMFVAGRPPMPDKAWPLSTHVEWPGRHSAKPEWQYDVAEHIGGVHAKKIELFARSARRGWESWGNQAPSVVPVEPDGLVSERASERDVTPVEETSLRDLGGGSSR